MKLEFEIEFLEKKEFQTEFVLKRKGLPVGNLLLDNDPYEHCLLNKMKVYIR